MKTNKTAILIHGGSMKAAFAAGAVYGLSKIGIQAADIVIGTGSSVPASAYFVSKQFEPIKRVWVNELSTQEFISYTNLLTGKPIFNLRYLIDVIFKRKYPLDVKSIIKSNSLLLIPLYNYREGKVEFINNHQEKTEENFWEILQAAMTIHNEHVIWGSPLEKFADADLDPFALYRQEIIPKDWNVLEIINHKYLGNTFKRWIGIRFFRFIQSRTFPEEVRQKLKIRDELIKSGFKLFNKFKTEYQPVTISPTPIIKLGGSALVVRNKKKLGYLFKMGEQVVTDMINDIDGKKALEIFIKRSKELSELSKS